MFVLITIFAILATVLIAAGLNFQPPYIPQQDEALRSWANNFAALITAAPATYGLTAPDAVTIQAVADAYDAALTIAVNPSTRTAPTVAAKDSARAALLDTCRPYAQNVRANLGVTNEDKLALGLNLIVTTRTPIPAPDSNPLLSVIGATQGVHTIRFADANTPDSRSKPFGAIALQLFINVGVAPVTDPDTAVFYASVTRQPFGVQFTSGDNGKVATYFGRWITRTGLVGPWSPPVSFGIVA